MFRRKPPANGNHNHSNGNQDYWWLARSTVAKNQFPNVGITPVIGSFPKYKSPEELWQSCCEYFQWTEEHPLYATQVVAYKGMGSLVKVPKMRAMTITGMCIFLGITIDTWHTYKQKYSDYLVVCISAESVIYHQKFTGAAADLLNASIIARDLGLKDQHEHTGKDGGPIQTQQIPVDVSNLSDKELEFLARMIEKTQSVVKGKE